MRAIDADKLKEVLEKNFGHTGGASVLAQLIDAQDTIQPSAQPERIRGRWILAKEQRREDIENGNYMYNCSNCDCGDLHSRAVNVSYCWNCGSDMRGEQNG